MNAPSTPTKPPAATPAPPPKYADPDNIKFCRQVAGKSRAEAAAMLQPPVAPKAWKNWELGLRKMREEKLDEFKAACAAQALGEAVWDRARDAAPPPKAPTKPTVQPQAIPPLPAAATPVWTEAQAKESEEDLAKPYVYSQETVTEARKTLDEAQSEARRLAEARATAEMERSDQILAGD